MPDHSPSDYPPSDPITFHFASDGTIPNSRLPLLVYRAAQPADAAAIERTFAANR